MSQASAPRRRAHTGPLGWMETHTRRSAADELSVPLPALMSSAGTGAPAAPFHPEDPQNITERVLGWFSSGGGGCLPPGPVIPANSSATLRPFSVSFSRLRLHRPRASVQGRILCAAALRGAGGRGSVSGSSTRPVHLEPNSESVRSCCSSAGDVRRNGNAGTETLRRMSAEAASRRTRPRSGFRSRFSN